MSALINSDKLMNLSNHGHSFYTSSSFLLTHIFPILMNKILLILLAQTVKSQFSFASQKVRILRALPFARRTFRSQSPPYSDVIKDYQIIILTRISVRVFLNISSQPICDKLNLAR